MRIIPTCYPRCLYCKQLVLYSFFREQIRVAKPSLRGLIFLKNIHCILVVNIFSRRKILSNFLTLREKEIIIIFVKIFVKYQSLYRNITPRRDKINEISPLSTLHQIFPELDFIKFPILKKRREKCCPRRRIRTFEARDRNF